MTTIGNDFAHYDKNPRNFILDEAEAAQARKDRYTWAKAGMTQLIFDFEKDKYQYDSKVSLPTFYYETFKSTLSKGAEAGLLYKNNATTVVSKDIKIKIDNKKEAEEYIKKLESNGIKFSTRLDKNGRTFVHIHQQVLLNSNTKGGCADYSKILSQYN